MMCDISEERLQHLRSLYPDVEGETRFEHMINGANLRFLRDNDPSPRPRALGGLLRR